MSEAITYVGIDAHARELAVAMLHGSATEPVTWRIPNEPGAVRRLRRKLERDADGPIACCYEAGPCGYTLQRQLTSERIRCEVIAPSLMPRRPGDRVKTDRRDARKLAELHRAGLLTPVCPPTPEEEAARDLCRARDDARIDLLRGRHRLTRFLLRRGLQYAGRNWTRRHQQWLDSLSWSETERLVVEEYRLALAHLDARLTELDRQIETIAQHPRWHQPVAWLRCFRGIDTLTAVGLLTEIRAMDRFPHPRALMAYTGLVPSEDSSGARRHRGRITKTGNAHLRRLLVEAAWHYQHDPRIGVPMRQRRLGQPAAAIALADKAQSRLCRRYRRLRARHKPAPQVVVAIARELVGFIGAAVLAATNAAAR
jgi:transposase